LARSVPVGLRGCPVILRLASLFGCSGCMRVVERRGRHFVVYDGHVVATSPQTTVGLASSPKTSPWNTGFA
jgi:hypothetical protein